MFKKIESNIDSGISLYKRFKKLLNPDKEAELVDTLAGRFVYLFQKHGIYRNQVPRFFDRGLTYDDFDTNEKLTAKLTPEILQAACDLFAIRMEWLEGVDKEIYSIHSFYKHPENYSDFLTKLIAEDENKIIAHLIVSTDITREEDALLILEEQFDWFGENPVKRYHFCANWIAKYWKSRADLTACIAITIKNNVFIKGWKTSSKITSYTLGEGFIGDLYALPLAYKRDGMFSKKYQTFYPDSWIYDPQAFLEGVDEGESGKINALKSWLSNADKGYMETGYNDEEAYAKFSEELKK